MGDIVRLTILQKFVKSIIPHHKSLELNYIVKFKLFMADSNFMIFFH